MPMERTLHERTHAIDKNRAYEIIKPSASKRMRSDEMCSDRVPSMIAEYMDRIKAEHIILWHNKLKDHGMLKKRRTD